MENGDVWCVNQEGVIAVLPFGDDEWQIKYRAKNYIPWRPYEPAHKENKATAVAADTRPPAATVTQTYPSIIERKIMNTVEVIGLIGVTFILVRGTIFNAVRTKIAEWKQAKLAYHFGQDSQACGFRDVPTPF